MLREENCGLSGIESAVSACTMSSLVRPVRSGPNRMPTLSPSAVQPRISAAARRGVTMRWLSSRLRAVVATTRPRSATAASTVSNSLTLSSTTSAPDAARWALGFGQPSRGATRRRLDRPQFSMARAAMPMFSPSCGRTRMIVGATVEVARPLAGRPIRSLSFLPRHTGEGWEGEGHSRDISQLQI